MPVDSLDADGAACFLETAAALLLRPFRPRDRVGSRDASTQGRQQRLCGWTTSACPPPQVVRGTESTVPYSFPRRVAAADNVPRLSFAPRCFVAVF